MKNLYRYLLAATFFACLIVACKKNPSTGTGDPATITSINPTTGSAGSPLTITGTNFSAVATEDTVKFNGVAATVTSASTTSLAVVIPTSTTGPVTVKVKTAAAVTGPVFTYTVNTSVTTIIGITPTLGPINGSVVITGTNFNAVPSQNIVKFNGAAATVTAGTTTSLVVTTPASTTGPITVKAGTNAEVTGPVFNYPTIVTGVTPGSAAPGASIVINGTDFMTNIADNAVYFPDYTTLVVNVKATVTAATSTSLTVTVPTGATSGKISVLANDKKTTLQTPNFTMLAPPGLTWQPATGSTPNATQGAVVGDKVLLANRGVTPSIYYSADGVIFGDVTSKLPISGGTVYNVTSNGTTFYVSTDKGLFTTTDGNTWATLFVTATYGVSPRSVSFNGSNIYVSTSTGNNSQFYMSSNNGGSWTKLSDLPFYEGAVVKTSDNNFYGTGGNLADHGVNLSNPRNSYKSTDGGLTWSISSSPAQIAAGGSFPNRQNVLLASGTALYVVIDRLYRSADGGGVTWATPSLPSGLDPGTSIYVNGATIVVGNAATSAISISTDNGVTWQSYTAPAGVTISGVLRSSSYVFIIANTVYRAAL